MRTLSQVVRYFVVGGVVFSIDFLCFVLLASLAPDHYLAANLVAKATSAAVGFFLHGRFTFSGIKRHSRNRQGLAYIAVLTLNVALSSLVLFVGVSLFSASEATSKLIAEVFVMLFAFLGSKYFVFSGGHELTPTRGKPS